MHTGPAWRKPSLSAHNSNCVEVTATRDPAAAPHKPGEEVLVLVRDSKDPAGPVLAFTTAEWEAFVSGVKDGEFDDIAPGITGMCVNA
jgi:Domain of unknown function (DUF397)